MQYKIFTISIFDGEILEEEMNKFLRNHKIIEVEKHFSEAFSAWTFSITYIENAISANYGKPVKKEKIDYKEVLDEKTFAKFAKLREARKIIANDEGVPAFAVFTNEELAAIAALEDISEKNIASLKDIGEKRAEKYGEQLIQLSKLQTE